MAHFVLHPELPQSGNGIASTYYGEGRKMSKLFRNGLSTCCKSRILADSQRSIPEYCGRFFQLRTKQRYSFRSNIRPLKAIGNAPFYNARRSVVSDFLHDPMVDGQQEGDTALSAGFDDSFGLLER